MMAEPRGESYLRFERETRLASWVIYLGCAVWVVWVGATRWLAAPTAPTAATNAAVLRIDAGLDRTEEVVAALEMLPPDPPLSYPPAPEGMAWAPNAPGGFYLVLDGEWSPATRPDQFTMIQHLQTPGVTRSLDMLAAVEPGGWHVEILWLSAIRHAARLLLARAR